jgi:hypothetical protein
MSKKKIPIYKYPGGYQIEPPTENVTYKWIDDLGGGILPGPLDKGTLRPDGEKTNNGICTIMPDGKQIIEYHYASRLGYHF